MRFTETSKYRTSFANDNAFGYFGLIQSNLMNSLHLRCKQQDSVKMQITLHDQYDRFDQSFHWKEISYFCFGKSNKTILLSRHYIPVRLLNERHPCRLHLFMFLINFYFKKIVLNYFSTIFILYNLLHREKLHIRGKLHLNHFHAINTCHSHQIFITTT